MTEFIFISKGGSINYEIVDEPSDVNTFKKMHMAFWWSPLERWESLPVSRQNAILDASERLK